MTRQFTLPDLGEGIAEAQIIRVLIKPGEQVILDQNLVEVETDKAAVEIPSPFAGVAKEIHVKEGQTINVGEVIVTFDDGNGAAPAPAKAAKSKKATVAVQPSAAASPVPSVPVMDKKVAPARRTNAPAAPVVRKLARELGVDLDSIVGSGPGGRITKEDIKRQAAGGDAALPAKTPIARRTAPPGGPELPGTPDTDKWGPIRRVPLNQIRKTIAKRMSRAAFTIPHVTHCDEVDVTRLDRLRRELNEATDNDPRLTLLSFVIRAVCLALRQYPIFNASFDEEGEQIIYKDYINLGIAVDSQRGLIVPVIRDAGRLTLRQIARELRSIADRVRANRFAIEDLRGGTFTITNVGALGGMFSTPIINHPEVAILGLGRTHKVPVLRHGELKEALMLPINLSFDHRATDGANAARCAGAILQVLEMPTRLLLDA